MAGIKTCGHADCERAEFSDGVRAVHVLARAPENGGRVHVTDLDLSGEHFADVTIRNVTFAGETRFDRCAFAGQVRLEDCAFTGYVTSYGPRCATSSARTCRGCACTTRTCRGAPSSARTTWTASRWGR